MGLYDFVEKVVKSSNILLEYAERNEENENRKLLTHYCKV